MKRTFLALVATALFTGTGWAQDQNGLWVQVEAFSSLSEAQEQVQAYAARLPDVTGWALSSGWYAIALGPYNADDARAYAAQLRGNGVVPADSYATDGATYRTQFWPIGEAAHTLPQTPPAAELPVSAEQAPTLPDESRREAEASESRLTRTEREELQRALLWAGSYEGNIDGAFGRGTRAAMAAWQEREGYEATGVLTTSQRTALLSAFNAPLESLGLQRMRDEAAGIEIDLPMALVAFEGYDAPFSRFTSPDGALEIRLISQSGDAARLSGLYELLQSQPNVPAQGARQLNAKGFSLLGHSATQAAYAEARLEEGAIKGFLILGQASDSDRLSRLHVLMRDSFSAFGGALAQTAPSEALTLSLPRLTHELRLDAQSVQSGVFVDNRGHVLTAAAPISQCATILLNGEIPAKLFAQLDGAALLAPERAITPRRVASIGLEPAEGARLAVAGYPLAATLSRSALTFGTLAGRSGAVQHLALSASAGDIGGPLLDAQGAVVGLLLPPPPSEAQLLAPDVQTAVAPASLRSLLSQSGISGASSNLNPLSSTQLLQEADGFTVQVSCS